MGSRFRNSFGSPNTQRQQPFNNPQDLANQFNSCSSNPIQFLSDRGINIPQEYAGNPQMIAQYLLSNTPAVQKSGIFKIASMIKSMLGFR